MKYYRRTWDETTGDELTESLGRSSLYFEVGEDDWVVRQVQVFENGKTLKYCGTFREDQYGSLADQPLDREEFSMFEISKEEFDRLW